VKLSKVNQINPDKRTFTPSKELILSRRDVGIEIEAENFSARVDSPTYWKLVEDGSLRNSGIELVSDVIRGKDIISALDTAQEFCKKNKLMFSDRCSVHIHLDVRHLDTTELIFLVCMYTLFEKFLFLQCGDPDREYNNHCRPIQSSAALHDIIRALFSSEHTIVHRGLNAWPKYSAFNLKPIITQGSIEFRHHVGTANKEEILRWINIIFSLALYVRTNKDNNLQEEIDKVCLDGQGLFNAVFPKHKEEFTDEVLTGMFEGARYIQVPLNTLPDKREDTTPQLVEKSLRGLDSPAGRGFGLGHAVDAVAVLRPTRQRIDEEQEQHRARVQEALFNFRQVR